MFQVVETEQRFGKTGSKSEATCWFVSERWTDHNDQFEGNFTAIPADEIFRSYVNVATFTQRRAT